MIKSVLFFRNGNAAIFDEHGEQIPQLQAPWLNVYLDYLKRNGANVEGLEISMPDGRRAVVEQLPEGGYNWSVL